MDQQTQSKIIQANVDTHQLEAPIYEAIHYEIFNPTEQKRLHAALTEAAKSRPSLRALDLGCGTGNMTEKLLALGFIVDAVDLSKEMIEVLRSKRKSDIESGRLKTHVGLLEHVGLEPGYGLITSYSVIHHLPDYLTTIHQCIRLLAPGGAYYIDHESLDPTRQNPLYRALYTLFGTLHAVLRFPYLVWRKILKTGFPTVYKKLRPNINYDMSDYWVHEGRSVNAEAIRALALKDGCEFQHTLYLSHGGRWMDYVLHPLFGSWCVNTQVMVIRKPL